MRGDKERRCSKEAECGVACRSEMPARKRRKESCASPVQHRVSAPDEGKGLPVSSRAALGYADRSCSPGSRSMWDG